MGRNKFDNSKVETAYFNSIVNEAIKTILFFLRNAKQNFVFIV